MRSVRSPGLNRLIPVTAGRLPCSRGSPAHLTASLPDTAVGLSVTTTSVSQQVRHSPDWES